MLFLFSQEIMMEINQLSSKIIKAAIEVHKALARRPMPGIDRFFWSFLLKGSEKSSLNLSDLCELERLKGAGERQEKNLSQRPQRTQSFDQDCWEGNPDQTSIQLSLEVYPVRGWALVWFFLSKNQTKKLPLRSLWARAIPPPQDSGREKSVKISRLKPYH